MKPMNIEKIQIARGGVTHTGHNGGTRCGKSADKIWGVGGEVTCKSCLKAENIERWYQKDALGAQSHAEAVSESYPYPSSARLLVRCGSKGKRKLSKIVRHPARSRVRV